MRIARVEHAKASSVQRARSAGASRVVCPREGYLLRGDYASFGRFLYGDSAESLRVLDRHIDVLSFYQ
jgi:hypothetical protein